MSYGWPQMSCNASHVGELEGTCEMGTAHTLILGSYVLSGLIRLERQMSCSWLATVVVYLVRISLGVSQGRARSGAEHWFGHVDTRRHGGGSKGLPSAELHHAQAIALASGMCACASREVSECRLGRKAVWLYTPHALFTRGMRGMRVGQENALVRLRNGKPPWCACAGSPLRVSKTFSSDIRSCNCVMSSLG